VSAEGPDKKSEQGGFSRAIADLEAVDAVLAKLVPSEPADGTSNAAGDPVAEARELLRAAITKLESAKPIADATAPGKRRVKVKAIGDTSAAADTGKPVSKSGGRRKQPVPVAKPPAASLLARLGAAAVPSEPETPAATADLSAPESSEAAPSADHGISAEDAVNRLARLEAEIESLTRPPAQSVQAEANKFAAATRPPQHPAAATRTAQQSTPSITQSENGAAASTPRAPVPEVDYEDDDGIEITIVGGKSNSNDHHLTPDRPAPRILRHAGATADDDADVEIVRPGAARRETDTTRKPEVSLRIDPTSPNAPDKGSAPSRWRLFRGLR
jgi:hypothetical protein